MKLGTPTNSIEDIQPFVTPFTIQKIEPEEDEPVWLVTRTPITTEATLLALYYGIPEFRSFNTTIIRAIYSVKENVYRITTEDASEYLIQVGR